MMKGRFSRGHADEASFTLVEVLIAVSIFTLITGGTISSYLMCQRIWRATSLRIQTTQAANLAMARILYGIETNDGLRSAGYVLVHQGFSGIYNPSTNKYPPAPNSFSHGLIFGAGGDGSWRMFISNYDGKWSQIDYNIDASNLVYWPPGSVAAGRKLIANYVTSASASNTGDGVVISLCIVRRDGNFLASNQVRTFVKMRNH